MSPRSVSDLLQSIQVYYMVTRGIGHTHLMLGGLVNADRAAVLVLDNNMAHNWTRQMQLDHSKIRPIPMHVFPEGSRGIRVPLAIDNSVIFQLVTESLAEIDYLKVKCEMLEARERTRIAPHSVSSIIARPTGRFWMFVNRILRRFGFQLVRWLPGR